MPMELVPGATVGRRYVVKRKLGAGGMAEVHLAYDPKLDLDVALKVLPPFVAGDPSFLARFRREGQVLARLNHPSVLRLYEIGEDEEAGLYYLVLEYLSG
ncbi:MAG: protein kinase, partial [Chloroflexi bacterium]|nr:protein kinase [Chloroflexota bacterium]